MARRIAMDGGEQPAAARFEDVSLEAGHYESFYVKACHPDGGLGVWIRYTVHKRPGRAPEGSLWFTLFDAGTGVRASKVTWPDPRTGDGEYIVIGDARFGPGKLVGAADSEQLSASWELEFSGREPPLWHLPRRWMYRAPIPRTKVLSPHPAVRFDGTVGAGERRVDLDGWPGMVGHNWGTEHATRAIWLHAMGFDGRPGDWLDVALGRIVVGPLTTPWIANGAISLDGERHRLGGVERVRSTRAQETPESCRFVLPGRGIAVEGDVGAPRERFVGWLYAQPAGPERQTVNCSIADISLRVRRTGREPLVLRLAGGAAYELQMQERYPPIALQPFGDG
jgi:hypothetical protein